MGAIRLGIVVRAVFLAFGAWRRLLGNGYGRRLLVMSNSGIWFGDGGSDGVRRRCASVGTIGFPDEAFRIVPRCGCCVGRIGWVKLVCECWMAGFLRKRSVPCFFGFFAFFARGGLRTFSV